jgi:hypothetical protein
MTRVSPGNTNEMRKIICSFNLTSLKKYFLKINAHQYLMNRVSPGNTNEMRKIICSFNRTSLKKVFSKNKRSSIIND